MHKTIKFTFSPRSRGLVKDSEGWGEVHARLIRLSTEKNASDLIVFNEQIFCKTFLKEKSPFL